MRAIRYILGIVAWAIALSGCDEMGTVGSIMQPDGDKSIVYTDTFMLKASTVELDSIYAKSYYGLLGDLSDPLYGTLNAGYISQLYCEEGFKFRRTPIDGKIDSVVLSIYYERDNWIGDTLAPMQVTVFPVVKPLAGHFYTGFDPQGYVDMQHPLARLAYTPRDITVSDSLWNLPSSNANYYQPYLRMRLPDALGQSFYDETVNNPSTFASQQAFNRFFPGLYMANTFGSGNIIVANGTLLSIHYRYTLPSSTGEDSTANASEWFQATEDIIQLNKFRNTDMSHLLEPSNDFTYLKTPAGVYTRITIPAKEIFSKVEGRKINNAYFSLTAMPQEDWKYTLTPPPYLLILPEDSLANFFRDGKTYNSVTSYASLQKSGSNDLVYRFGNIGNMLVYYIRNNPGLEELNLLVIPIENTVQTDSYGNVLSTTVSNYLRPSGLKLRKDPAVMQFQIISNRYNN